MKAQRVTRHIPLLLFNLDAIWGLVANATPRHASAALPPGKTLGTHLTPGLVGKGGKNLSPTGIFFLLRFLAPCLYFIGTYLFFLIVLHFYLCLKHNTNIHAPAGSQSATIASDRPQTLALDRSATGIGRFDSRTVQPVAICYTD